MYQGQFSVLGIVVEKIQFLSIMGFDKEQNYILSWDGMIRAIRKNEGEKNRVVSEW